MSKFKNILNLIADLQEKDNSLDDLYILTSKAQKRKISKTSIQNIKTYLLQ